MEYKLVTENQWLHMLNLDFEEFEHVQEVVQSRLFVLALEGNKIVGMISFVDRSLWMPQGLGIGKVQVHSKYRNQGICTHMIEMLFEYANKYWDGIAVSPYEPDGERWLKPLIARYSKQYPSLKILERA